MNNKTLKIAAIAGAVVVLSVVSFSKTFAQSETCADGKAYWEGEIGKQYIYSNIVDDHDDNYKIHGRVYVCNDFGKSNFTEGWTKGLGKGKNKHIHTDVEIGLNVPGITCKANYSEDYPAYEPY